MSRSAARLANILIVVAWPLAGCGAADDISPGSDAGPALRDASTGVPDAFHPPDASHVLDAFFPPDAFSVQDAGGDEADAGRSPTDAGTDAGEPSADAGVAGSDAGSPAVLDASAGSADAGEAVDAAFVRGDNIRIARGCGEGSYTLQQACDAYCEATGSVTDPGTTGGAIFWDRFSDLVASPGKVCAYDRPPGIDLPQLTNRCTLATGTGACSETGICHCP